MNHTGAITTIEIKKILGNGGATKVEDKEWEQIIDEVDEDGNGEISFPEFKFMMYRVLGMQNLISDESNLDISINNQ